MLELFAAASATALSKPQPGALILGTAINAPVVLPKPRAAQGGRIASHILLCEVAADLSSMRLSMTSPDKEASATISAHCTLGGLQPTTVHSVSAATHMSVEGAVKRTAASITEVLRECVLPMCGATEPPSSPLAEIGIGQQGDAGAGWRLSPAKLDASLHLGVIHPGAGCRVPVALDVCTVPTLGVPTTGSPACLASLNARQQLDSSRGDRKKLAAKSHHADVYCRAAHSDCWPGVALSGLHTRTSTLTGTTQAASTTAKHAHQAHFAANALQQADYLYEVASEASTPSAIAASPPTSFHPSLSHDGIVLSDGRRTGLFTLKPGQQAASLAAAALQTAQALSTFGAGRLEYRTSGVANPLAPSAQLRARASQHNTRDSTVEGMLRTAATEMPEREIMVSSGTPSSRVGGVVGGQNGAGCESLCGGVASGASLQRSSIVIAAAELCQIRSLERGSLANLVAQPFSRYGPTS